MSSLQVSVKSDRFQVRITINGWSDSKLGLGLFLMTYITVLIFVSLSVCLYVFLSVHPSFCLSICLSICLSFHVSISLSVHLSVCPSIGLSFRVSICLHLSVCLSICPSICLLVLLPACLCISFSHPFQQFHNSTSQEISKFFHFPDDPRQVMIFFFHSIFSAWHFPGHHHTYQ